LIGHAHHSTAALGGPLHDKNSFDLAGPTRKCLKAQDLTETWSFSSSLFGCVSSSFISFCSHSPDIFGASECVGHKWRFYVKCGGRTRLMGLWNTVGNESGFRHSNSMQIVRILLKMRHIAFTESYSMREFALRMCPHILGLSALIETSLTVSTLLGIVGLKRHHCSDSHRAVT